MAVRITHIAPKIVPVPTYKVQAHLTIENFKWINEQSLESGLSSRTTMFDWIVNKKGQAYIKVGDTIISVFGAVSPTGQQYIRCIKGNQWSDELLDLPLVN
ncbi:MAG: Uncharacterized protein G01um10143_208 [Parcubacteria group bacterium Gr01-1014_3]|nr:MAG: Uncharacterized protein G01um10143_208 [Parcubacteria group bacterium Gr01-1014_3]